MSCLGVNIVNRHKSRNYHSVPKKFIIIEVLVSDSPAGLHLMR